MNLYWIWLNELDGIGPVLSKRLLKAFGSPENIYRSSIKELQGKYSPILYYYKGKLNKNNGMV